MLNFNIDPLSLYHVTRVNIAYKTFDRSIDVDAKKFSDILACFITSCGSTLENFSNELSFYLHQVCEELSDMLHDSLLQVCISAGCVATLHYLLWKVWNSDNVPLQPPKQCIFYHQKNIQKCVSCHNNPVECIFLECGHICMCVDCLKAIPSPRKCPLCQCKINLAVLSLLG